DRDQLLGGLGIHKKSSDAAVGDRGYGRLDVVWVVVASADDQQILDATDDEELVFVEEPQIACPQPCFGRDVIGRVLDHAAEGVLGLVVLVPVPGTHVVAVHPDL